MFKGESFVGLCCFVVMIWFVVPAVWFVHNALFKWCGSLGKLCKGEYACWTSCESSSYSLWCLDKLNYWEALGKMKTQRAILRLILFLLNLFNSKKDIRNPKLVRCQDLVGMNGLQCTGGFTRAIEWWMSWSLRPHIKSPSLFWNLINSFLCFCHLMYY